MDALIGKNPDKDARDTTQQHLRAIHDKLPATPRKADAMIRIIRPPWSFGKDKLDWPPGDNPAASIHLHGTAREYEPWPEWRIAAVPDAPEDVHISAELIPGTGQRPNPSRCQPPYMKMSEAARNRRDRNRNEA